MNGIERIAREYKRARTVEGYTRERDMLHKHNELAWAAVCYAAPEKITAKQQTLTIKQWVNNSRLKIIRRIPSKYINTDQVITLKNIEDPWPFKKNADKREKHGYIRRLEIAGALISAEIDKLLILEKDDGEGDPSSFKNKLGDLPPSSRSKYPVGSIV